MVRDKLRLRSTGDVLGEIKRVARHQLKAGGPAAVSLNGIGRELDVSGPALYRYFPSRDALLTALIIDGYDALAAATAAAIAPRRTPATRLAAYSAAYRRWAVTEPHAYRLLFRAPLPGFEPNTDEFVRASQAAMSVLLRALQDAPRRRSGRSQLRVQAWLHERRLPSTLAPTAQLAIELWTRLHGLVSLEIEGCYTSMHLDPSPLYRTQITLDR